MLVFALVAAALVASCEALGKDVVELTPANFKSKVLESDDVWLVEFFAPWCGHCKNLEPEWTKAATALKGIVKLGAVDADAHRDLGGQYGVQGFPTIKVFGSNKAKPTDYQGGRTAKDIVSGALDAAKTVANERLSGKSSGSSKSKSESGSGSGSGSSDVVELTDETFESAVLNSNDLWLVEFFAPWCGHCKNLAPEWAKASTELKGVAKLGAVDATVHSKFASKYGVKGYPTIFVFGAGPKSDPEPYEGGRTASAIVEFAKEKASESKPAPEVFEITNKDAFTSNCLDQQLCFIAFLPDLLDSQASGRNQYIQVLQDLAHHYRKRPFGWAWAAANSQSQIEGLVGVGGFGYPALTAVNNRKKRYSTSALAFSESHIKEFVGQLITGRHATVPFNGDIAASVQEHEAWDGQDAVIEAVEEIDLSSLDEL